MIEKALIFTKPMSGLLQPDIDFGVSITETVRERLGYVGIWIKEQFTATIDRKMLDIIYPGLSPALRGATQAHLDGKVCRVAVYQGYVALNWTQRIIGMHANPALCSKESVRFVLWNQLLKYHINKNVGVEGIDLGNGTYYWYNYAHCTRTAEEFDAHYPALNERRMPE